MKITSFLCGKGCIFYVNISNICMRETCVVYPEIFVSIFFKHKVAILSFKNSELYLEITGKLFYFYNS